MSTESEVPLYTRQEGDGGYETKSDAGGTQNVNPKDTKSSHSKPVNSDVAEAGARDDGAESVNGTNTTSPDVKPVSSNTATAESTESGTTGEETKTVHSIDEDDDEGIDVSDSADLDSDGRNKLFERGLKLEQEGKKKSALKCYFGCLKGLKQDTNFSLLPQCLRNIADIFYHQEDYAKAIHFIQAEKVYYESALIDTTDVQKKLVEEAQKSKDEVSINKEILRAEEFEELAKMCLDKKQPQLALEYAGKATKIRQRELGDSHPATIKSLDFFASVYADAGAEQYQESLKKMNEPPPTVESVGSTVEPVSILRKRKSSEKESKKVRFDESQLMKQEKEEKCAKTILWILFFICIILLLILGSYLYCHTSKSKACSQMSSKVQEMYNLMRFYMHLWFFSLPADSSIG